MYKSKEERLLLFIQTLELEDFWRIMANFPEMLEEMDDQMLIGAAEDFEVSIFLQTSWFFWLCP